MASRSARGGGGQGPRKKGAGKSTIEIYREKILNYLLHAGQAQGATIAKDTDLPTGGSLYSALNFDWFIKTKEGLWHLTPEGKTAARELGLVNGKI